MVENSIEKDALNGNIRGAWEELMDKVGLNYKDIPNNDNLFYNTAGISYTGKMSFVNDVIPREILARDDSKETKRLTAVLMAASKAYNFADSDSPYKISECAKSLEEALPFVAQELQHFACYRIADIYGKKATPSDDFTKETRKENLKKQEEYLLKAFELSPNQSVAKMYADDYLIKFTKGGYEDKSNSKDALNKEIEMYEKVLEKPSDSAELSNLLHNELSKGYTCKANQTNDPEEKNKFKTKANQHKAEIVLGQSKFRSMGKE